VREEGIREAGSGWASEAKGGCPMGGVFWGGYEAVGTAGYLGCRGRGGG
jgi:hypothetical protein